MPSVEKKSYSFKDFLINAVTGRDIPEMAIELFNSVKSALHNDKASKVPAVKQDRKQEPGLFDPVIKGVTLDFIPTLIAEISENLNSKYVDHNSVTTTPINTPATKPVKTR